jgi:SAM-dependent methyltransferase/uncharacterized protein YbaR (Trm112 family)
VRDLPLICPACRTRTARGRELHTVSPDGVALRCDNSSCRRAYPIVDGIPILVSDLAAHMSRYAVGVVERDFDPTTQALLAGAGPDDAPYAHLAEHLSIYLDSHWGDRAAPPPDGSSPVSAGAFGMAALAARLAARAETAPVARAVELGCGVGRGVWELGRGARSVVGVDLQHATLRRARRLLGGAPLDYARRIVGRHYAVATIAPPPPSPASVTLVCADAMDPPLVPGSFERVVALNVLDAVTSPPQIVAVADGLCAPGGEVILASPYAWQSGVVAEEHRFGEAAPADALRRRLVDGTDLEASYTIEDEAELAWSLRRDARSTVVYRVHWLRARKAR